MPTTHDDVSAPGPGASPLKRRTYEVIFGHDTRGGRLFDVLLIAAILASVLAIMLESVPHASASRRQGLRTIEWVFTVLFTVEYALRLWCVRRKRAYALSFFGIIDVLAILPTWLSLVVPGGQALSVIRVLRVLRVFRILKLARYVVESNVLSRALKASRYKITVFVFGVLSVVVVVGSLMYLIEGPEAGFTSIPTSVYWAVVTLTTVGFGDITPLTPLGKGLATVVMIFGYGIIAVPTGIVSVELAEAARTQRGTRTCPGCGRPGHDPDAIWCKWCGAQLN
jgi:voltage-gated potassium channel